MNIIVVPTVCVCVCGEGGVIDFKSPDFFQVFTVTTLSNL